MAYFSRFPLVNYGGLLQVNLTRRVDFLDEFRNNPGAYIEYTIEEGMTPELLADRFYDDVNQAWVILAFNQIVNVFEEWPKGQKELESYIEEAYEDPNGIHHWKSLSSGVIVCPVVHPEYDRVPVTNFEYEVELNEKKREIKLLLPEFIGTVNDLHKRLMRE